MHYSYLDLTVWLANNTEIKSGNYIFQGLSYSPSEIIKIFEESLEEDEEEESYSYSYEEETSYEDDEQ